MFRSAARWPAGTLVGSVVGVLVASGLTAVLTVGAATPAQAAAVVARTGTLDIALAGPSGAPAQRIDKATVRQDLRAGTISAAVTLKATPSAATTAVLRVAFGRMQNNTCVGEMWVESETFETGADGSRAGAKVELARSATAAEDADWDCAFAVTYSVGGDPNAPYHAVGTDNLQDVLVKPRAKIAKVSLLDKVVHSRLALVPAAWTPLDVRVRNNGTVAARAILVDGRGEALKIKNDKVGWTLDSGDTATATIQVKLLKRKRTTLTLISKPKGGEVTKHKISIVPGKAPALPKAGKYRGDAGRVTFRIKRDGKVVGFRVMSYTTCGGYPDLPTYNWAYYDFPTAKIAKNGIVDARSKGADYSVHLEMLVKGAKVTRGRFDYTGPNRCWASSVFDAVRR